MINIEKIETFGWETAIRGMRNPMNSWSKSDSGPIDCTACFECSACKKLAGGMLECTAVQLNHNIGYFIGSNDYKLMTNLAKAGSDHGKYRRMVMVAMDITAPLYWWKEFDTYKVGTVANSCSTMHKIHSKMFTSDDFSTDHLEDITAEDIALLGINLPNYKNRIDMYQELLNLNWYRSLYMAADEKLKSDGLSASEREHIAAQRKKFWWLMIQKLPSSYNQKRTVTLNYEVLANMYRARKNHKLDEWREFCKMIEDLPYSELITLKMENKSDES